LEILAREGSASLETIARKVQRTTSEIHEQISSIEPRLSRILPFEVIPVDGSSRLVLKEPSNDAKKLTFLRALAAGETLTLKKTADDHGMNAKDLKVFFQALGTDFSGFGVTFGGDGTLETVPWLAHGQPLSGRAKTNYDGKIAIANEVAKMIVDRAEENSNVFLGAGSQAALVATKLIQDFPEKIKFYNILTENLEIAREFGKHNHPQIVILGGKFQPAISGIAHGEIAKACLELFPPDIAFVSWHFVTATDDDIVFRADNAEESSVKVIVTEYTKRLVIYGADGLKLERKAGLESVRASQLCEQARFLDSEDTLAGKEFIFVTETYPRGEAFSKEQAKTRRERLLGASKKLSTRLGKKSRFTVKVLPD